MELASKDRPIKLYAEWSTWQPKTRAYNLAEKIYTTALQKDKRGPREMQNKVYMRELFTTSTRMDTKKKMRGLSANQMQIMKQMCKESPKIWESTSSKTTIKRQVSRREYIESIDESRIPGDINEYYLMNLLVTMGGHARVDLLVDTSARCNMMHENTLRGLLGRRGRYFWR